MNKFAKFPVVLGLVGAVCAGALGFVYQVTKPIIEQRLAAASLEAIQEVMPTATLASDITASFLIDDGDGDDEAALMAAAGIAAVYEVKVNTTLAAYAYQATGGGWSGQPITILFVISATTNNFIGMKVVSHTETPTIGGILLDSSLFAAQFVNLDVTTVSSNVNLVAGATSNLTLNAVKAIANKVVTFHIEEVKGEVVKEIPDAAFAQLRFPAGTTYVDVTDYYETLAGANLATIQAATGLKYLYYAKDANNNVLGFVYYFHYIGTKDYSGHGEYSQYIKGLFGFTFDYKDAKLFIVDMINGTDEGAGDLQTEVIDQYTVDDISTWFTNNANVPYDTATGVTITSNEIVDIIQGLVQYHAQLGVSTIGG